MKSPNVWRLHSAPSSCLSGRTYLEPCTRMTTMGNAEDLDAMSKCFLFILLVLLIFRPNNDAVICAEFNYPRASAFWFVWRLKNSESVCCHQLRLLFTLRWELNNSTILSIPLCFHRGPILLYALQQINISAFWKPREFCSPNSQGLSTKLATDQITSLLCIMCPWNPKAHSKLPCFILYLFEAVSQVILLPFLVDWLIWDWSSDEHFFWTRVSDTACIWLSNPWLSELWILTQPFYCSLRLLFAFCRESWPEIWVMMNFSVLD